MFKNPIKYLSQGRMKKYFDYDKLNTVKYSLLNENLFNQIKENNDAFAKAFLQDFLDIKIEDIEILGRKNFITDKALLIEFDYRCKLDNKN